MMIDMTSRERSIGAVRRTYRESGLPEGSAVSRSGGVFMARLSSVLALAMAVFLAAPAVAQQGDPIKIGVIEPLSGPVAASGNYIRMGAEIARDWINARGGVLGRPIALLIEDNKSDPKEAATAAEKLIVRDKVPVIMGAWGSSM